MREEKKIFVPANIMVGSRVVILRRSITLFLSCLEKQTTVNIIGKIGLISKLKENVTHTSGIIIEFDEPIELKPGYFKTECELGIQDIKVSDTPIDSIKIFEVYINELGENLHIGKRLGFFTTTARNISEAKRHIWSNMKNFYPDMSGRNIVIANIKEYAVNGNTPYCSPLSKEQ